MTSILVTELLDATKCFRMRYEDIPGWFPTNNGRIKGEVNYRDFSSMTWSKKKAVSRAYGLADLFSVHDYKPQLIAALLCLHREL